jgi:peptidoglycan-associated lipoprotein
MIRRFVLLLSAAGLLASAASAQLPGLRRYTPRDNATQPGNGRQQGPVPVGIDALRADFAAQSGGTTVYFGNDSVLLAPPARAVLAAQAAWLRRHPEVVVRIEGYGDGGDTRDHALAVGARRAGEARDYLLLLGVPAAQVSITSWGKERPGLGRAVTILVS